jgi:hypothetical protein
MLALAIVLQKYIKPTQVVVEAAPCGDPEAGKILQGQVPFHTSIVVAGFNSSLCKMGHVTRSDLQK